MIHQWTDNSVQINNLTVLAGLNVNIWIELRERRGWLELSACTDD